MDAALKSPSPGIRPLPTVKGSKKAAVEWEGKSAEMPPVVQIEVEFNGDFWIAAQAGQISAGLECIDFDDPECYGPWLDVLDAYGLKEVVESCYVQQTPKGGYHVVYRADGVDWDKAGNLKLASKHTAEGKKTRIETRGEGGYFLIAPSPGYVPKGGSLGKLPTLTAHQRRMLLDTAKTFDVAPKKPYVTGGTEGTVKPGKDFDAKSSWDEVLSGWVKDHERNGVGYWIRPGKKRGEGISATTGYAGTDLLYVFSSNASPFEDGCTYSKFAAHAFLHHGGNFNEAARDLAKRGYGDQARPMQAYVKSEPVVRSKRKTLADYELEDAKYLFDDWRYLRVGNNNLFDAKGGSGKTTLILSIAAMASIGVTPTGVKIEPFKTLYYGSEDSGGELRTVFTRLGGDPSMFVYVDDQIVFDAEGLEILREDLAETKAKLFVLDAAKYYLPGRQGSEFDGPTVARFCAGTRSAAREFSAALLLVRHFTRFTKDRDLLDQGAGLSQWYDSCRSNLVALKHPEKVGNSIVFQAKGSILTQTNPPFGCGYSHGEYGFWQPTKEDFLLFGMDEEGKKSNGRPPETRDACATFLEAYLSTGPKAWADILDEAESCGLKNKKSSLYRAGQKMKVQMHRGVWSLFDPYADSVPSWGGND